MKQLTKEEAEIMLHTSITGRYVSNDPLAIDLGKRGLLCDYGPQALAGGDHYLMLTPAGRAALSEWKSEQPKPPRSKRRRQSPTFVSWRNFLDAGYRMSFSKFVKEVWPRRHEYQ